MKKMVKKVMVVVMVLVVVALSACRSESVSTEEEVDFKVYDAVDDMREWFTPFPDTQSVMDFKDLLEEAYKNKKFANYLDWTKFEKLQSCYSLSGNIMDVGLTKNQEFAISNYMAFYEPETDAIYLMPAFFEVDTERQMYCLFHEMTHALMYSTQGGNNLIIEGEVDDLAVIAMNYYGVDIYPSYPQAIMSVEWLHDLYGRKALIEAIRNDKIDELVPESDVLCCSMVNAQYGDIDSIYQNISFLYDLSVSKNKNYLGKTWVKKHQEYYSQFGLILDKEVILSR